MAIRRLTLFACVAALCATAAASAATPPKRQLPESSQSAPVFQNTFTLIRLSANKWELYVENTNNARFITNFTWQPPYGLTIRSITRIVGGQCTTSDGGITCSGSLPPASCYTCEGGGMTVDFRGDGLEDKFVKTSYGGYYLDAGWQTGILHVTKTSKKPVT